MDKERLNTMDTKDGFSLSCGLGRLPSGGSCNLYNGPASYNPALLRLAISHKGNQYLLSQNDSARVYITTENGKRNYGLHEAWFTNVTNGQDSALVKGVFCEP